MLDFGRAGRGFGGRGVWIGLAWLAACGGDKTVSDTDETAGGDADTDVDTDTDTDADTDSATDTALTGGTTDTAPTGPSFACFADEAYDLYLDGTADYSGLDGYDAKNVDLLLYSDRDFDHDGVVDQIDTWVYDAAGNPTRHEQSVTGFAPFVEEWSWDPYGNPVYHEVDEDGDGVPEYTEKVGYDALGNVLTLFADTDGDGVDDLLITMTRDAYGALLLRQDDEDGDGAIDITYTSVHDAAWRVERIDGDRLLDGTIDYVESTIFTDPVLEVGTTTVDEGNDGVPELVYEFSVDAAGYLLYYAEDTSPDGRWDFEQVITWDEKLDLLLSIVQTAPGVGGTYPVVLNGLWTYDGLERLIEFSLSADAPTLGTFGFYRERETFVFGGTCPS